MYSTALSGVQGLLPPDTDWVYAKKREAQEIIPGLWLGPFGSARDQEFLKRVNITDALVVRAPEEARRMVADLGIICPKYPEFIHYEVLRSCDSPFENIIRFFADVKLLLDAVLARGGRILVHGNAGMSRSAALVVAYVMEKFNLPSDQAHTYVLTRRHCISINEGFRNQIREYEMLHRVQLQVNSGMLQPEAFQAQPHGQKRPAQSLCVGPVFMGQGTDAKLMVTVSWISPAS
ncbi:styx-b [Symbiodinium sp. CCMP2456]|nr:styx-b [Symbiodinium sp. CCMP2456]